MSSSYPQRSRRLNVGYAAPLRVLQVAPFIFASAKFPMRDSSRPSTSTVLLVRVLPTKDPAPLCFGALPSIRTLCVVPTREPFNFLDIWLCISNRKLFLRDFVSGKTSSSRHDAFV